MYIYGSISEPGIGPNPDGTSMLSRGAFLAARWRYEPQALSNQWTGVGFLRRAGRYRPGDHFFRPRIVGVVYL